MDSSSESALYAGVTLEELQSLIQDSGYRAQKVGDGDDGYLKSGADGISFFLNLHGREASSPRAHSIQCRAGFSTDFREQSVAMDRANTWNARYRFGKAYVGSDHSLWLEMDIVIWPAIRSDLLLYNLEMWRRVLASFVQFVRGPS
jgi:hypothetical protein